MSKPNSAPSKQEEGQSVYTHWALPPWPAPCTIPLAEYPEPFSSEESLNKWLDTPTELTPSELEFAELLANEGGVILHDLFVRHPQKNHVMKIDLEQGRYACVQYLTSSARQFRVIIPPRGFNVQRSVPRRDQHWYGVPTRSLTANSEPGFAGPTFEKRFPISSLLGPHNGLRLLIRCCAPAEARAGHGVQTQIAREIAAVTARSYLSDDWDWPKIKADADSGGGYDSQGVVHASLRVDHESLINPIMGAVHGMDRALHRRHPSLSAAAASDFYNSWQVHFYLREFCRQVAESDLGSNVRGHADGVSAEHIENTLNVVERKINTYAREVSSAGCRPSADPVVNAHGADLPTRVHSSDGHGSKGDINLLKSTAGSLLQSVGFPIAERYAGISPRRRQQLMKGVLAVVGKGQHRRITVESLLAYCPAQDDAK